MSSTTTRKKTQKDQYYLTIFMWVKHELELRHLKFHIVYLAQEKHIIEFEPLQDFAATITGASRHFGWPCAKYIKKY